MKKMQLIVMGCEYAGKRTLGRKIYEWWCSATGEPISPLPTTGFHDHFVLPYVANHEEDESHKEQSEADILKINPGLLEHYQRYQIQYHFQRSFVNSPDLWLNGWYYAEAVYAPFYYGYGRPGEYGDRRQMAKLWDMEVLELAPAMVLVLMKASPDVIQRRLRDHPRPKTIFEAKDAAYVSERFQDEYDKSLLDRRFTLDTTNVTVEQSLYEFIEKVGPYLTKRDQLRLISQQLKNTAAVPKK